MKDGVSMVLAAVAGLGVSLGAVQGAWGAAAADTARVGLVELEGAIKEKPSPFAWLGGGKEKGTLRELVTGLKKIAKGSELQGVVIRLKDAELTGSQVQELAAAMAAVRQSGKKVHVYAEGYGPAELLLGAAADEVIIQSGGAVSLPGIAMTEMFLADMFAWAGITPDFVQVGDYKGASEMFANAKPSKAWDENINGLLDAMYGQMRAQLKSGRKLSDAQLDKAMEIAWMASDADAKKAGLVDAIVDLPDLGKHLEGTYGGEVAWDENALGTPRRAQMDMSNPFALLSMLSQKPKNDPTRPTIAVLHVDGAIIDGDSEEGGLFGGGGSVGSRTLRRALSEIENQDLVKGVVIRIDSPGGSAIASEIIWQGVKRVSQKKPVWVSIGSMAASGGYYIAVSGQRIYVNPSSIVGSIGVVGGKIALGGLLEKVHVNTVTRTRGPRASMMDPMNPWSEAERALVRQKMTETYDLFTSRVTAGRTGIDLGKTAEGRLFLGSKAVELKMADKVGGLDLALTDLAAELKLTAGGYDVMDYPGPKGFEEFLEEMLGGFGASAQAGAAARPSAFAVELSRAAKAVLGEQAWGGVASSAEALLQLQREPVILVGPRVLIFK